MCACVDQGTDTWKHDGLEVWYTHTHTHRCALSKEQTLYLMSIKRWWLKSQVHSIFPRAMFISAPGRRLFSKFEMSPWAESGDSALLSIFPAAPAVLKKKMPLRKPIWAYQPYQQKMNLNSGCRWWYWDNAWWVRNIVGGKMCIIIYICLCVSMCVSIHAIHTRSFRDPNNVISVKGKEQPDNVNHIKSFSWSCKNI